MEFPYINIHTHERTGQAIEVVSVMASRNADGGFDPLPDLPCSLGIHPWYAGTPGAGFASSYGLDSSLHHIETAEISAVGEIGLDYHRPVPRSFQIEVFEAQLKIAQERRLPVILHCVRAFEPVMDILSRYRPKAVIFHGFVGSRQQASRALGRGYYLSFGERSLASPKTVEAMRSVPPGQMFFETDESPLTIADIYRLADRAMFDRGIDSYKEIVYDNYIKVFGV